jgi:transaldolase/glucose-6-phosphate isomerase
MTDLALDLTIKDAKLEAALAAACATAVKDSWADRAIGRRDPSVWSDQDVTQRAISTRLGWLEAPFHFADLLAPLRRSRRPGPPGSPPPCSAAWAAAAWPRPSSRMSSEPAEDGMEVRVLDSTDPAAVAATLDDLDPLTTLFIVSTKSGTTAESLSFQAYQWERIDLALGDAGIGRPAQPGDYMAAITDPDKSLKAIPHHDRLRRPSSTRRTSAAATPR